MQAHIIHTRTRRPGWRWAAAGALTLSAVMPWFVFAPPDPAPSAEPLLVPAAQLRTQASSSPVPAVADRMEAVTAAPPTCPHQTLEVRLGATLIVACTTSTRTRQNGSLRSFEVGPEGLSRWKLRVDTGGGRIVAAKLTQRAEGRERATEHACAGDTCRGFSIGPPDRHGVRLLQARAVALATATGSGPTAVLDGTLQIAPDRQHPALACAVPSLDMIGSDGGTLEFCPAGGAGFELSPDGRTHFVFHDLEGRRLAVTTDALGAVLRVSQGALACEGVRCGGIAIQVQGDPADPSMQRQFTFSGTNLSDPRQPGVSARLTGQLAMPAQE